MGSAPVAFGYTRGRYLAAVLGQDLLLAAVVLTAPFAGLPSTFPAVLAAGAALVLAWGVATLNFPSRVELDDAHITFHRYGRVHRFAWSDVTRVRVRRFLVRDRVLLRVTPSGPFRGRYWLLDGLEGFDALIRELERRS